MFKTDFRSGHYVFYDLHSPKVLPFFSDLFENDEIKPLLEILLLSLDDWTHMTCVKVKNIKTC